MVYTKIPKVNSADKSSRTNANQKSGHGAQLKRANNKSFTVLKSLYDCPQNISGNEVLELLYGFTQLFNNFYINKKTKSQRQYTVTYI
jgi:hypothetical protein